MIEKIVQDTIVSGGDLQLNVRERCFFYAPLCHSEAKSVVEHAVLVVKKLCDDAVATASPDASPCYKLQTIAQKRVANM